MAHILAGPSIFLGNLPYEFTKRDLSQLLADYHVGDISLPMDQSSGKNKGKDLSSVLSCFCCCFCCCCLYSPGHVNGDHGWDSDWL